VRCCAAHLCCAVHVLAAVDSECRSCSCFTHTVYRILQELTSADNQDQTLLSDRQCQRALSMQVSTGQVTKLGPSRLYTAVAPSPDGEFLLVAWLERPFSYNVPCGRFPKRIQLWDK